VQVFFKDGTATEKIEVEYPVGHRRRRAEGLPLLVQKFKANAETCLSPQSVKRILTLFEDVRRLEQMPVDDFVEYFVAG
jgi:2-methylcitrate dehydratase